MRSDAVAWIVAAVFGALALALVTKIWRIQGAHECRWDRAEAWEEFVNKPEGGKDGVRW